MEIPKGFKKTEVGIIPSDWDIAQLGNLFEITSSKRVFQNEWKSSGVPFYRARELAVLSEKGAVDNELFITKEQYNAFKRKHGVPIVGDMLVTGVGTLGKVYVVPDEKEFYFKDGNIIWFKIRDSINSEFLRQLYFTQTIIKQIDDAAGKTTVGTYTITGAKKTSIPYPPTKAEQTAIAEALNDADALITELEKLIAKKKAIKQGAMQELLKPKEGWEVKPLNNEIDLLTGFPFPSNQYSNDGVKLLRGSNVKRGITDWTEENTKYWKNITSNLTEYILNEGDIVIAMDGSLVGKSFARLSKDDLPALLLQRVARIRADKIDMGYLKEVICSDYFTKYCDIVKTASAIPHISPKDIKNYQIPIPPTKSEQKHIAQILSDMDAKIKALEKKLDKYKMLKQGMMQSLLTGRIRLI